MKLATVKGRYFYLMALAAAVLMITAGWAGTAVSPLASSAEVVQIATKEQLADFRDRVNKGEVSLNAKLTADIDMSGVQWKPIGELLLSGDFSTTQPTLSKDNSYTGTFDGAGHTITNLKVTSSDAVVANFSKPDIHTAAALFGVVGTGGRVENLTVSADITNEPRTSASTNNIYGDAAAIVGYNHGTVTNCTAGGTVTAKDANCYAGGIAAINLRGTIVGCSNRSTVTLANSVQYVGGITGHNDYGTISGCSNSGTVKGLNSTGCSAGGIAGAVNGTITGGTITNGTITNCTNSGTVSGGERNGGIAGWNHTGKITNCTNSGSVTTDGGKAGGIAGWNNNASSITNCTNSGTVETIAFGSRAGGIAGHNDNASITNCTNSGSVTTDGGKAGGIAGWNNNASSITNCTNSGTVETIAFGSRAGGIAGHNDNASITNCTNSGSVTKGGGTAGGIAALNDGGGKITNCGFITSADLPAVFGGKTTPPDVTAVVSLDKTSYDKTAVAAALDGYNIGSAIPLKEGESFTMPIKLLSGTNIASADSYYEIISADISDSSIASVSYTSKDVTVKGLTSGNALLNVSLTLKATDFEQAGKGSFGPTTDSALLTFTVPITVTGTAPTPTATGSGGCNAGLSAALLLAPFALMRRKKH